MGGDGRTGVRSIEGASCAETSALLAFATALAVEDVTGADGNTRSTAPTSAELTSSRLSDRAPVSAAPRDVSLIASTRIQRDDHGSGLALGASALFRRGLVVVGVLGDLGGSRYQGYWALGPAAGLAAKPFSWARVDILGMVGANAYFAVSPSERASSDAKAVLPVVGARVRASVQLSNVVFGLEGLIETNVGSAMRRYVVNESFDDPPANREGTFSIGTARVAVGIVLGTTLEL